MGSGDQQAQERANRAVRNFNRLVPGLQAYARAVSGRPVSVRADALTSTDGDAIMIRPPLALADTVPHEPRLCDRRDGDNRPLCPACLRGELVHGALYREIGHVVCESLRKCPAGQYLRPLEEAAGRCPPRTRDFIMARVRTLKRDVVVNAYEVASMAHPYLLPLVRMCDDNMIERRAFAARPGVAGILYHIARETMDRGNEDGRGGRVKWTEAPVETQIVIALCMEMHGWLRDGDFGDEVTGVVRHPSVQALVDLEIGDMLDVVRAGTRFLGALNALGYLLTPETVDEDKDKDDEEGDGDSGEQQGDGGAGEAGAGEGSPGDGDGAGPGGGGDPGPEAGGDGAGGPGEEPGEGAPERGEEGGGDGEEPGDAGERGDAHGAEGGGGGVEDGGDDGPSGEADQAEAGPGGDAGDAGGGGGEGEALEPGRAGRPQQVSQVSPADLERAVSEAGGHGAAHEEMSRGYDPTGEGRGVTDEHVESAVSQCEHFEANTANIGTVRLFPASGVVGSRGWSERSADTFAPPDARAVAGPLMRARKVFSENAYDKHVHGLKRGKLSARTLGARGWRDEDERLFKRTLRHRSVDDAVMVGMDISGSTAGGAIADVKAAAWSMAELLHRLGVDFAVTAHTTSDYSYRERGDGQYDPFRNYGPSDVRLALEHYEVKGFEGRWDAEAQRRMAGLTPRMGSFDGHNFEMYRKALQRQRAQRRLLVYFTDGSIPETNGAEEGRIMLAESELYRKTGVEALIVAVRTSLRQTYGFDQVRMRDSCDLSEVVQALEGKLTRGR